MPVRPFPVLALVRREFISQIRSTQAFSFLVLFVGGCAGVTVLLWPRPEEALSMGAYGGKGLIARIVTMLAVLCCLFVPALGATRIVGERERDTLDLLRLTLLRPSGLLLGKGVSTVGFFLLLLIAAKPVFSAVFFLVGIDWIEIAQLLLIILTTAMVSSMIGLYASAARHRPATALIEAYVGVLLYLSGMLFLTFLSPFMLISMVFSRGLYPGLLTAGMAYQAVMFLIFYAMARQALNRPPKTSAWESGASIDDKRLLRHRRTHWPFYLVDPLRRKKPIEDGRNPMAVRELRWGLANRADNLIRLSYITVIFATFSGLPAFFGAPSPEAIAVWLTVQMALTLLMAPAINANVLVKEFEQENIDMIRMTLATPREIILGKWWAAVAWVFPVLFASVFSAAGLMIAAVALGRNVLDLGSITVALISGYAAFLVCIALSAAATLCASVLARRTIEAAILGYAVSIAVFLPALLLAVVEISPPWLEFAHSIPDRCASAILFSPIVLFPQVFFVNQSRDVAANTLTLAMNLALYAGISLLFLRIAIRLFTRRRMRDP